MVSKTSVIPSVMVQVKHHMWLSWAAVAVDQEAAARAARGTLVRALVEDVEERATAAEAELHSSMQAVAAAAHAIDGLYGGLRDLADVDPKLQEQWVASRAARHVRIRGTLAAGLHLENRQAKRWKGEFGWLFGVRDQSVHPDEAFNEFVPHPEPTHVAHVSPEAALFSFESAKRATALLLEVLETVTHEGSARNERLSGYTAGFRVSVAALRQRRQDLAREVAEP